MRALASLAANTLALLPLLLPATIRAEVPAVALQVVDTLPGQVAAVVPAGPGRLWVATLEGRIWVYENGLRRPQPLLDIRDRVGATIAGGLAGVALHPRFSENGFFFVHYDAPDGTIHIARFRAGADRNFCDPASQRILLSITNDPVSHAGGDLAFGPDGYLWVPIGDGGGDNDPFCSGQSTAVLRGKLLRLDVNQRLNLAPFYGIPPTNPYRGAGNPPDEIWASGLRNPWRLSFDRQTGDLYLSDVGQDTREEVNVVPAGSAGGLNFGWKVLEGTHCVGDSTGCGFPLPTCSSPLLTPPALEYPNQGDSCAVVGGYVYRGGAIPGLAGAYIYGDFCSGRLFAARPVAGQLQSEPLLPRAPFLTTFGEDSEGELYLGAGSTLFRLVRAPDEALAPCVSSPTRLCVLAQRFAVTARYTTPAGLSGDGQAIPLTSDSGYFWFFNAANPELFAKVRDACVDPFRRFWVFAAGLTNVEVRLTVTDTSVGHVRVYENPQGRAYEAVQDTGAFTTCP